MKKFESLVAMIRAARRLDPRTSVFDVRAERRGGVFVIEGESTEPAAIEELVSRTRTFEDEVVNETIRLPDPALGDRTFAVVRSAVAPLCERPHLATPLVSQVVLGQTLQLLSARDNWYRVRGQDSYIGWIHRGFIEAGTQEWARQWERGRGRVPIVSIGAELIDDAGAVVARVPWGGRLVQLDGGYQLPDGRTGKLGSGQLLPLAELPQQFPLHGESIVRTAKRWLGAPYLWGGVTPGGVDCSGMVQAVYRVHGITLPRDSSLQANIGTPVDISEGFSNLRLGDLIFFNEVPEVITHVGICTGESRLIHAAVGNGGVAINDLRGNLEIEIRLRSILAGARRILPGAN